MTVLSQQPRSYSVCFVYLYRCDRLGTTNATQINKQEQHQSQTPTDQASVTLPTSEDVDRLMTRTLCKDEIL